VALIFHRFLLAQYVDKHRTQPDGSRRNSDNWKRGIPLDSYRKSLWRHFFDASKLSSQGTIGEIIEDALCGVIFNAQGWLHELVKARPKKS
jgi:hypothetical protein